MKFAEVQSSWNFVTLLDRDVNILEWKGKTVKQTEKMVQRMREAEMTQDKFTFFFFFFFFLFPIFFS